jgi:DNA-binding response OmpR family regulator
MFLDRKADERPVHDDQAQDDLPAEGRGGRAKIVVIEDEVSILEVIAYNLSREGYEVTCCQDGRKGLTTVQKESPELVLLDLMLPDLDGVEVCRMIRSDPIVGHVPIIMVSARGDESDILLGLGVGADDYIPKPFSPKELVARVSAALRRARMREAKGQTGRLIRGPIAIDTARHEVEVDNNTVRMTPTEFRLLHLMASYPGRVFSRHQLLSHAIGDNVVVTCRNIDVHIRSIRKKLGPRANFIETTYGIGYRFREADRP